MTILTKFTELGENLTEIQEEMIYFVSSSSTLYVPFLEHFHTFILFPHFSIKTVNLVSSLSSYGTDSELTPMQVDENY
jgi:hypothetical protein